MLSSTHPGESIRIQDCCPSEEQRGSDPTDVPPRRSVVGLESSHSPSASWLSAPTSRGRGGDRRRSRLGGQRWPFSPIPCRLALGPLLRSPRWIRSCPNP